MESARARGGKKTGGVMSHPWEWKVLDKERKRSRTSFQRGRKAAFAQKYRRCLPGGGSHYMSEGREGSAGGRASFCSSEKKMLAMDK